MEGSARREVVMAWQIERFARMKTLRNLKHYLDELKPKKAQTQDEMLEVLQAFASRGLVEIQKPN